MYNSTRSFVCTCTVWCTWRLCFHMVLFCRSYVYKFVQNKTLLTLLQYFLFLVIFNLVCFICVVAILKIYIQIYIHYTIVTTTHHTTILYIMSETLLNNQQVTYATHVVQPSYVLQPNQVTVTNLTQPPPFQGDTFIEMYGGDLFSCDTHIQSCLFSWFCMPGATGKIAGFGAGPSPDGKEEDGCICLTHCMGQFWLPFCWPCIGANANNLLETRIAAAHNELPASAPCGFCGDVLLQLFCGCCATARSLRAIRNFKQRHGSLGGGPAEEIYMVR